ncbi:GNAT family N-acetyltransferase [Halomicroarcula sp. GCM10025709]|uniref:GNAT family N-acetyltransferase n=1 Tax=Haloarcula TaxID=2237 RepID=UPI0024C23981|nr:GNAT family N-acetyltransferase [Halomicroarcula sp. YJ-61-S]
MEIRSAQTADADTIADQWVALAAGQRAHGSHLSTDANRSAIREVILQRIVTDRLRVAVDDEAVVGFVMFSVETGRYEQDVVRGVVENLYVVPSARDDGIGSALLTAAEDALAAAGVDVISLEAMADNDGARRFYHAHGYTPHRVEFEKSTESDTL